MKMKISVMFLLALLMSCTSFRETHYFKDKINDAKSSNPTSIVPNYYRVSIRGWSFMSSSRYLSGYFNQEAVNEYFNEIPQVEKGRLFTKENSVEDSPSDSTAVKKKTEPQNEEQESKNFGGLKEDGSELVLILSSNSEAIATQIKNTSVNNDVIQSLALMANKDKLEANEELENQIASKKNDMDLFALKIDNYITSLKTDDTSNERNNKEIMLQLLISEIRTLGASKSITSFNDIKKWYNENN
ncbi:hypothetical protein [Winogradskyella sp. A2]|uniref:hypothetical protein n=1 Tax=Winogradskyella sp. A2 TaxID=3366944 RepID=UPI00398C6F11